MRCSRCMVPLSFLALVLVLAGAAGAQESDEIALPPPGSITVSGNLPMEDVAASVPFAPCPVASESPPVAGLVGSTLELDVDLGLSSAGGAMCSWTTRVRSEAVFRVDRDEVCRCMPGNTVGDDAETCQAMKTETLGGIVVRVTASQPDMTVPLPELTGVYELRVYCRADTGIDYCMERPLYVTYSDPMAWLSPPRKDWFERAACWGEGFSADATEHDVLEGILAGVYRHGAKHWGYGYAFKKGSGVFEFTGVSREKNSRITQYQLDADQLTRICDDQNIDGVCGCRWTNLVAKDTVCNFSDCYVFSRTFQAISAVMGIGGMETKVIWGEYGNGFSTSPDVRSLDPRFRANIDCRQDLNPCYPYEFGNHNLRGRDGLWYDATFQRIYDSPSEAYGLSATTFIDLGDDGFAMLFPGRWIKFAYIGYGTWPYSVDYPGTPQPGELFPAPYINLSAELSPGANPLSIESVLFSPSPSDADGLSRSLNVHVTARLLRKGAYSLVGTLFQGDTMVANRSAQLVNGRPPSAFIAGPENRKTTLTLSFSGEQIRRSGLGGQYTVRLEAYGDDQNLSAFTATSTTDFEITQFGTEGANIIGCSLVDQIGPAVDVDLHVVRTERYGLEARLARGGETLAYAGTRQSISSSKDPTRVHLPIDSDISGELNASGGPLELTVLLFNQDLFGIDICRAEVTPFSPGPIDSR